MNLGRFQLSLNHNDPDIVTKGLEEFQAKILLELTNSPIGQCSFGMYGRPCMRGDLGVKIISESIESLLHPSVDCSGGNMGGNCNILKY